MLTSDFLVVGGGVIGLAMARQLAQKGSVNLIEKNFCGAHASGRNSGVIHAGIYYKPGSSKAIYSVRGNKMLSDYCREKKIDFKNIGKIVAPTFDSQADVIDILYQKGKANGAPVEIIDYHQAKEIEPRIKPKVKYLWSPSTSIANNKQVIQALKKECIEKGVKIYEECGYQHKISQHTTIKIQAAYKKFECKFLVNCAGLYVDKIAHDFGFGLDYEILPFRGLYLYGRPGTAGFNTLVYPTPLGEHEFLGVHTTNTTDGRFKLGPTATPGFWKEHYSGLDNFNVEEFSACILRYLKCLASADRARYIKLLWQEIWKHSKKKLVVDAEYLVDGVSEKDYTQWGPVGMFAQMVDKRTSALRNDFLVEGDDRSMHLLNIVSPGWTSALAFTEDLAKNIKL